VSEPAPRRTKIVCTIGPATASPDMVEQLAWSGMDAARLNFSHGNHDSHLASIRAVRRAQELIGRPLAVIADLQGPKLRIAAGVEPRSVIPGDTLVFASSAGGAPGEVAVTFDGLADVAAPGQEILIADGAVRVRVTDVHGRRV
jgi:pyruvate kinase